MGAENAEFLRSQAQGILALDFFTADLLNGTKVYVLAGIEHDRAGGVIHEYHLVA